MIDAAESNGDKGNLRSRLFTMAGQLDLMLRSLSDLSAAFNAYTEADTADEPPLVRAHVDGEAWQVLDDIEDRLKKMPRVFDLLNEIRRSMTEIQLAMTIRATAEQEKRTALKVL